MPRNSFIFALLFVVSATIAQEVHQYRNVLATFGNMAGPHCADDDFSQVVFCALPAGHTGDFFIRIFDPDCGGALDRPNGLWETNTVFTLYGGRGCITEKDARGVSPSGNYMSGTLLQREIFAYEPEVDGHWVSFGPFAIGDGEQVGAFPGYVFFKLLVEGHTGDDGNVYGLFLSQQARENRAIEHSVFFAYERTMVEGDDLITLQADSGLLLTEEVKLPLQLDPLPQVPAYNIIAIPIKE